MIEIVSNGLATVEVGDLHMHVPRGMHKLSS